MTTAHYDGTCGLFLHGLGGNRELLDALSSSRLPDISRQVRLCHFQSPQGNGDGLHRMVDLSQKNTVCYAEII